MTRLLILISYIILSTHIVIYQALKINNKSIYTSNRINEIDKLNGFIFIDGDNVRGKVGFNWSKQLLSKYVNDWISKSKQNSRVVLFFDHGHEHKAYFNMQLNNNSLNSTSDLNSNLIIFAGPKQTVDDCISRDISYIQQVLKRDILVVTEDQELRIRCRKTSIKSTQQKRRTKKIKKSSVDIVSNTLLGEIPLYKSLFTLDSTGFAEYICQQLHLTFPKNCNQRNTTGIYSHNIPYLDPKSLSSNVMMKGLDASSRGFNVYSNIDDESMEKSFNETNKINSTQVNYILSELMRKQVELNQDIMLLKHTLDITTSRRVQLKLHITLQNLNSKMNGLVSTYQRVSSWSDVELDEISIDNRHTSHDSIDESTLTKESKETSVNSYNIYEEGVKLFKRLLKNNHSIAGAFGAEETWERVILAERFRQELTSNQPDFEEFLHPSISNPLNSENVNDSNAISNNACSDMITSGMSLDQLAIESPFSIHSSCDTIVSDVNLVINNHGYRADSDINERDDSRTSYAADGNISNCNSMDNRDFRDRSDVTVNDNAIVDSADHDYITFDSAKESSSSHLTRQYHFADIVSYYQYINQLNKRPQRKIPTKNPEVEEKSSNQTTGFVPGYVSKQSKLHSFVKSKPHKKLNKVRK